MKGRLATWAALELISAALNIYLAWSAFQRGENWLWIGATGLAAVMLTSAFQDMKEIKHAVR